VLNLKYIIGLLLIIAVVWVTMILCLKIIYPLLVSIELPSTTYIDTLIGDIVKLLLACFVILAWLYCWNMLVRLYFHRNLSHAETKQKERSTKGRKEKTRARHVAEKSA
jgi:Ca2+/H+ antiporter